MRQRRRGWKHGQESVLLLAPSHEEQELLDYAEPIGRVMRDEAGYTAALLL